MTVTDEQNFPTSRKEGSVRSRERKIDGKYGFLPKLVLTGSQWPYYSGKQENLEKNCVKERSQTLIVQGEVMTFAPQVPFPDTKTSQSQALKYSSTNNETLGLNVQCNTLFPLKVTNAIFCNGSQRISKDVKILVQTNSS